MREGERDRTQKGLYVPSRTEMLNSTESGAVSSCEKLESV